MINYENCQYCCDDVGMRDYLLTNGCEGVYIDKNNNLTSEDSYDLGNKKLNYCPMCGRKLE